MCPRMSLVIGLAALTAACNINPNGPEPAALDVSVTGPKSCYLHANHPELEEASLQARSRVSRKLSARVSNLA